MMTAGMRASRVERSHLVVSILSVERRFHRIRRNYFARSRASRTDLNRKQHVAEASPDRSGLAGTVRRPANLHIASPRHGLGSYLSGRRPGASESRPLALNIRAALEEAGGMFVKLGQVLSTRADLLPPDVIAELSMLQDHVTPVDPAGIEALLTAGPSPRHQRIRPDRALGPGNNGETHA